MLFNLSKKTLTRIITIMNIVGKYTQWRGDIYLRPCVSYCMCCPGLPGEVAKHYIWSFDEKKKPEPKILCHSLINAEFSLWLEFCRTTMRLE